MSPSTLGPVGFALIACAVTVTAQGLTLRVTAAGDIVVQARGSVNSIPANTDLTGGGSVQVFDFPPTGSTASAQVGVVHGPLGSRVTFAANCIGARWSGSGFNTASASAGVDVIWTSATPQFGRLRVEWCKSESGAFASFSGQTDVLRYGPTSSPTNPTCTAPNVSEYLVRVDAAGLAARSLAGGSASGLGMASASSGGTWTLTLTLDPDQPCAGQPYGASCGPRLSATTDAQRPGLVQLSIDDTNTLAAAVLLVGLQRTNLPLPDGCFLGNEMLLTLPLVPSGSRAATFLDPSPWPGLRLTAQGYALPLVPLPLRLTGGLEVSCR